MALADGNDDSHDDVSKYDVVFPRPWLHLTSEDVLVESYHEGVHMAELLRSADTATRKELARKGLRAFLKMLFEDNFVHADLHPGNILVCNKNFEPSEDGISLAFTSAQDHQLVFLDVGLVTSLSDYDRRNFIELFQAVIKGNGYKVGRLMIERSRGGRGPGTNDHAFCADMEMVVDEVLSRGFSLGKVHFAELLERILKMCYVHKVMSVCGLNADRRFLLGLLVGLLKFPCLRRSSWSRISPTSCCPSPSWKAWAEGWTLTWTS
jgi:aarF domain-containing kinase